MPSFKHLLTGILSFVILTVAGCEDEILNEIETIFEDSSDTPVEEINSEAPEQAPLAFSEDYIMEMNELDALDRPVNAHIQLSYDQKPTEDREPRIDFDPVGWHNYQHTYINDDGEVGEYWVMNRSHMIGYLFSGLNDEPKNLFTGTAIMNKGSEHGMGSNNPTSMLFYEMHLNEWLSDNPGHKIDLQVTPLYEGNELLPRQVRLSYTGYSPNGERIPLNFGSGFETEGNDATVVVLNNEANNLTIDYSTGRAEQTEEIPKQ